MSVKTETTMEALLIWALQRQRADIGCRAQGRMTPADYQGGASACGVAAVARQGELGTAVDCVGSVHLDCGRWLDPDAEAAYRAAEALGAPLSLLVIQHARTGTRPDWRPELRPEMPITDLVYEDNRLRARVFHDGRGRKWCRVKGWRDCREQVRQARLHYLQWWAALDEIMEDLQRVGLRGWTVTEIGAPDEPWAEKA